MFDKIRQKLEEQYGVIRIMDQDESKNCYYLRFIHNSTIYIARLSKISNQITIAKHERSITL